MIFGQIRECLLPQKFLAIRYLLVFTYVYTTLPVYHVYSYLTKFTLVYLSLPQLTCVYVYLPQFSRYLCLHKFTHGY